MEQKHPVYDIRNLCILMLIGWITNQNSSLISHNPAPIINFHYWDYRKYINDIQPHQSKFGGFKPHLGLSVCTVHLMFSNVICVHIKFYWSKLIVTLSKLGESGIQHSHVFTKGFKHRTSKPREGVIIDHDVIVIYPLGRFTNDLSFRHRYFQY